MSPFHFKTRSGQVSLAKPKADHLSTFAQELSRRPLALYFFSANLTTSSLTMSGAGGVAGEFPLPFDGYLISLVVFDGTTSYISTDSTPYFFAANDRISCYAQWVGGTYRLRARINGVSYITSAPIAPSIPAWVTLYTRLNRGAM